MNYACNLVFEGTEANEASYETIFIFKKFLPLLISFGVYYLNGYPIALTVLGIVGAVTAWMSKQDQSFFKKLFLLPKKLSVKILL